MLDSFKKRLIKTLAIILGVIVFASAMIIFLHLDMAGRIEVISEDKERLFLRDQRINALSSLSTKLDRADQALTMLDKILPEKDTLITFPDEVRSLAQKNNINYTFGFGAETISEDGKAGSIEFDVSAEGEFANVVSFLKAFEDHPYFITFDDLDIRLLDQASPGGEAKRYSIVTGGDIYTK